MDQQEALKKDIADALKQVFQLDWKPEKVALQPTRKEYKGNLTFVTFPLTKPLRMAPDAIAQQLGSYLKDQSPVVSDFNAVKGFLNLVVADDSWKKAFLQWQQRDHPNQPQGSSRVMIEFSSPNTNKPLHLGHLRNIFLGDAVARILTTAGHQVQKVNLVNDRGIHICKSMLAYEKFGQGETPASSGIKGDHLIGKYYVIFEKHYREQVAGLMEKGNDKETAERLAPLLKEAQQMLKKWEDGDAEVRALWEKLNGWVYEGFDQTYERIGTSFDQTYYESETFALGKDLVAEGLQKGVFFRREDGSVWADLTDEGLDEKLLIRSDGTSVYMTQDLGTAEMKYRDFPFDDSIYVVGNEQDYHFQVLFLLLKKLGRVYADGMYHLSYGMVDLPTGKMKSREGTVVDADDLMDQMVKTAEKKTQELGKIEGFTAEQASELYETLGLGALKYFLLRVDPRKRMLFNPEESIEFHGNTGPFIQYTHARIAAIQRKAEEQGISALTDDVFPELNEDEVQLIQLILAFDEKLNQAAADYSPATLAAYAYELAKEYNRYYAEYPIVYAEPGEAPFRVALSAAIAKNIRWSMGLLGISVPERM